MSGREREREREREKCSTPKLILLKTSKKKVHQNTHQKSQSFEFHQLKECVQAATTKEKSAAAAAAAVVSIDFSCLVPSANQLAQHTHSPSALR